MKFKLLAGICVFSLFIQTNVLAQRYGEPKEKPKEKPKENPTEKPNNKPEEKKTTKPDEKTEEKQTTYFQQEVNYTIRVKLNDVDHTLSGFEEIQYINNSPHTFRHLYFHLWPNAYKNNETALAKQLLEAGEVDFHYAEEKDRGFIDSLFFRANGDSIGWKLDEKNIDICKLYLKEVLKPGDTVTITTPFFVKLPSATFSRLGHLNQSYFITQWYPKPAVYDKNGWNQMPYLNQGEFYSEYGSFDVSITVPANYVVGATGDLFQCPEEEKFLEKKHNETVERFKSHTNKVGGLIGNDTYPASAAEWKTLRYKQTNVHDFAWFADKRWNVLRGEYTMPTTGRLVTTWAMFTNGNSRYWKRGIEYINDAIKYYSKWNGDYPYNQCTAVDGTISAGGGMEYPNITVIGDVTSDILLETVIMHEVGHNWFYGILGTNERQHGWMDEGINSFNELRYMRTKYPDLKMKDMVGDLPYFLIRMTGIDQFDHDEMYYHGYLLSARQGSDQPIELPSEQFTETNYGTIMYMKTATAFDFLRSFLGEKDFDKCMHAYFDTWKFKHPQPGDLRRIFEQTSKKNLEWFFDGMIRTDQYIDYKIKKCKKPVVKSTATYQWMTYEEGVMVKNKGGIAVPFVLQGIKADTIQQQRQYFGHDGTQIVSFPNGNYDKIVIDYNWDMPDINRRNNTLKYHENRKPLFKRTEKLRLKFGGDLEDPRRTTLYWSPVLGFNMYDGWMPGVAFYNALVPQKPLEFTVMPMFGTRSLEPTGHAEIKANFNTRQSNLLQDIHWTTAFDRYTYNSINGNMIDVENHFMKANSTVEINFRNKKPRSFSHHKMVAGVSYILEDTLYDCDGNCDDVILENGQQSRITIDANYEYNNTHPLHAYTVKAGARVASNFALLWSEAVCELRINTKAPVARLRFFGGYFLSNNTLSSRYNLRMDGQRGYYDYMYNNIFIGRNETEGLWSRQFVASYGGFKAPTAWGQSNKWLAALNFDVRLPIPIVRVFADLGVSDNATLTGGVGLLSDAGVSLDFGPLDVYFPLYISKLINDEYEANGYTFRNRIRFSLDIRQLNPVKQLKDAIDKL